jgi:hypothetical protein
MNGTRLFKLELQGKIISKGGSLGQSLAKVQILVAPTMQDWKAEGCLSRTSLRVCQPFVDRVLASCAHTRSRLISSEYIEAAAAASQTECICIPLLDGWNESSESLSCCTRPASLYKQADELAMHGRTPHSGRAANSQNAWRRRERKHKLQHQVVVKHACSSPTSASVHLI